VIEKNRIKKILNVFLILIILFVTAKLSIFSNKKRIVSANVTQKPYVVTSSKGYVT
jgi:hypothetical protein